MIDALAEGDPAIMTRDERQRWLSAIIRGEQGHEVKDQLKACELLGRTQGDYIEKREVTIIESDPKEELEGLIAAIHKRINPKSAAEKAN